MRAKKMYSKIGRIGLAAAVLALLLPLGAMAQQAQLKDGDNSEAASARLAKEVRHALVMLPYYSVFDNLEFEIHGVDTVVLSGQVVRPTLRSDAANVVARLEGVATVIDKVEVLPLSTMDDAIRLRTYFAIYSKTGLDRYALQPVPPIHIIVNRGHVTLVGVVARQGDSQLAEIAAKGVPGAFSVTNELRIEKS